MRLTRWRHLCVDRRRRRRPEAEVVRRRRQLSRDHTTSRSDDCNYCDDGDDDDDDGGGNGDDEIQSLSRANAVSVCDTSPRRSSSAHEHTCRSLYCGLVLKASCREFSYVFRQFFATFPNIFSSSTYVVRIS